MSLVYHRGHRGVFSIFVVWQMLHTTGENTLSLLKLLCFRQEWDLIKLSGGSTHDMYFLAVSPLGNYYTDPIHTWVQKKPEKVQVFSACAETRVWEEQHDELMKSGNCI